MRRYESHFAAPGARADLVLASTNPLEGPITIPPDGVMVRGHWHDHEELATMLAHVDPQGRTAR